MKPCNDNFRMESRYVKQKKAYSDAWFHMKASAGDLVQFKKSDSKKRPIEAVAAVQVVAVAVPPPVKKTKTLSEIDISVCAKLETFPDGVVAPVLAKAMGLEKSAVNKALYNLEKINVATKISGFGSAVGGSVGFVVISTAINDFSSDSLSPFIANTVMDHKSKTIPYSKFTIIFITQAWSLYCGVMSVASIALVFAQFDLILIRLVVDLLVNQYTIRRFLINKAYDPLKYRTEFLNEELEERDFSIDEHDPPTEYKDSCRLSIPLSPSGDNGARFDSRLAEHAARQLRKELDLDELPLDPRVDRAPDDKFIIKPKKKKLNLNEV
ncbi:hypothetical protein T484DRAFT_1757017 [Baffinella frigidus]|nr:hypothetical protein T484DRAFT_1757017 [Cryptophyta sp. CCMP2293]